MSDVSELSSILLHRQQAATQRSPGSGSPAAAPSPLHYSAAPSPSPAATSSSAAAAAIPNGPALYGPGPAPGPAADYHQASHASYQHQQPQAQAHPHQALPHTQRPPYPSPPPQSQPSQPPHRQHHFSAIPPPPPVPPHFQSAIESLVRPGASNLNEALGQLVAANFDTELLSAYIKNPSTDNMHALIRAWHAKQALSPQPQQHHHQQHQPPPSSSSSQSQHHRYPPHHQSQQPMSSRAPPSSRSSYPADKDVEVVRSLACALACCLPACSLTQLPCHPRSTAATVFRPQTQHQVDISASRHRLADETVRAPSTIVKEAARMALAVRSSMKTYREAQVEVVEVEVAVAAIGSKQLAHPPRPTNQPNTHLVIPAESCA